MAMFEIPSGKTKCSYCMVCLEQCSMHLLVSIEIWYWKWSKAEYGVDTQRTVFQPLYGYIILLERGITILHTCTALYAMAAIQSVCNPNQL